MFFRHVNPAIIIVLLLTKLCRVWDVMKGKNWDALLSYIDIFKSRLDVLLILNKGKFS